MIRNFSFIVLVLKIATEQKHVFKVLLSQVHRLQALDLLGCFLDMGSWAVNLALSVGIFPYVLKLLQSNCKDLRPMLIFIWTKILSVDKVSEIFFNTFIKSLRYS